MKGEKTSHQGGKWHIATLAEGTLSRTDEVSEMSMTFSVIKVVPFGCLLLFPLYGGDFNGI